MRADCALYDPRQIARSARIAWRADPVTEIVARESTKARAAEPATAAAPTSPTASTAAATTRPSLHTPLLTPGSFLCHKATTTFGAAAYNLYNRTVLYVLYARERRRGRPLGGLAGAKKSAPGSKPRCRGGSPLRLRARSIDPAPRRHHGARRVPPGEAQAGSRVGSIEPESPPGLWPGVHAGWVRMDTSTLQGRNGRSTLPGTGPRRGRPSPTTRSDFDATSVPLPPPPPAHRPRRLRRLGAPRAPGLPSHPA